MNYIKMLWNNSSALFSVFKILNREKILIMQANQNFCRVFRINFDHFHAKEVERVFNSDDAKMIKEICILCISQRQTVQKKRYLNHKDNASFWNIIANAYTQDGEYFVLFCIQNSEEAHILPWLEKKNGFGIIGESIDYFIIQLYYSHYNWIVYDICRICNAVVDKYQTEKIQKNIFDVYPLEYAAFLFYHATICFNHRKRHHMIRNIELDEESYYLDITFIPKITKNTLFVLIKNITDQISIYERNRNKLCGTEFTVDDLKLGIGIVDIKEDKTCELIKSNPHFFDSCLKTKLNKETFLAHPKYHEVMGKKKKTIIELPASDGSVYEFNLVPEIVNGEVKRIFITTGLAEPSLATEENANLTQRELQVLRKIYDGDSNEKIAVDLSRSIGTVKKITYNLYQKLKVHSRGEAVKKAVKYFNKD